VRRLDPSKLADETAERIRTSHHDAIVELQGDLTTTRARQSNYLGRQVFTSSGTYTPSRDCYTVILRMVGAGGGGGGAGGGAGLAGGGGGNGGWFIETTIDAVSPILGGRVTIGTGGVAGVAAAGTGGTGGDTTAIVNGVTYTAKGGTGASGGVRSADGLTGPIPAAAGSTAVEIVSYDQGGSGLWFNSAAVVNGAGGMTPFGYGGATFSVEAVGNAGARGGGGSGGVSGVNDKAGGAGGAGMVVIDEWGP
jgi:hypothetical protein